MLDDLFDIFDRDRRRSSTQSSKRGLRGLLHRLAGEHDDDGHDRRPRRYPDRDDDEPGWSDRSPRRRDRLDWDD